MQEFANDNWCTHPPELLDEWVNYYGLPDWLLYTTPTHQIFKVMDWIKWIRDHPAKNIYHFGLYKYFGLS